MSTAKARNAHAKAVLGTELHSRLANTSVLLVGAGGIGCELRAVLTFKAELYATKTLFSKEHCPDRFRENHFT